MIFHVHLYWSHELCVWYNDLFGWNFVFANFNSYFFITRQLPINSNDATTGNKLQGMSKDVVIISSWPTGGLFKNWDYVVLSRVRTRNGLYLFEEMYITKSFKLSRELALFFDRAREKEQTFLEERKKHENKSLLDEKLDL